MKSKKVLILFLGITAVFIALLFGCKGPVDRSKKTGGTLDEPTDPIVTGITVSRHKIALDDPDKKVTVTVTGKNLTKVDTLYINGIEDYSGFSCKPSSDTTVTHEYTLPDKVKDYTVTVSLKNPGAIISTVVKNIEAKVSICKHTFSDMSSITMQDGSAITKDAYETLAVESNTNGKIKVVLSGKNFDIDGFKAGIRFNGKDYDGKASEDGKMLVVENIDVPNASGTYQIVPQYKKEYRSESSYTEYKDKSKKSVAVPLRVKGDAQLRWVLFDRYEATKVGKESWIAIGGENLDTLSQDDLDSMTSSLGGVISEARVRNSFIIDAKYTRPQLPNGITDPREATETITLAGKTVSSALHTLKITFDKEKNNFSVAYDEHNVPSDGKVILPEGVNRIGNDYTYPWHDKLKEITFPKTLAKIDGDAFNACDQLKTINLSDTQLTELPSSVFSHCTNLTDIKLPKTLKKIGNAAFSYCEKLPNYDFSGMKIVEIGERAFAGCKAFTEVDLSGTAIEKIGERAFQDSPALTGIKLPATVTTIGNAAFSNCTSLKTMDLSQMPLSQLERETFSGCKNLESVQLPQTLTQINDETFSDCEKLKTVDLSETKVTKIWQEVFKGCVALETVQLPKTLKEILGDSFNGCTKLTALDFSVCPELTAINLAGSGIAQLDLSKNTKITDLSSNTFSGCSSLTALTMPDTVTIIEHKAFFGCSNLTNVVIPKAVKKIGMEAFVGCNALTSVTFLDPVGWGAYPDQWDTDPGNAVTIDGLDKPGTAATLLTKKSTETPKGFADKYWRKK